MTVPAISELADALELAFAKLPAGIRPQRYEEDDGRPSFGASRDEMYLDLTLEDDGTLHLFGEIRPKGLAAIRALSEQDETGRGT